VTEEAGTGTIDPTVHVQKQWIWPQYTILSGYLQLFHESKADLNLVQNPPNFPPRYFENSQKIRYPQKQILPANQIKK